MGNERYEKSSLFDIALFRMRFEALVEAAIQTNNRSSICYSHKEYFLNIEEIHRFFQMTMQIRI